jgi:DNA modification methylase
MFRLINSDCLNVDIPQCKCIFADPPDNIGLGYIGYEDEVHNYPSLLYDWLHYFVPRADIIWFSFNAKWIFEIGYIVDILIDKFDILPRMCIQTFTFGSYNDNDLTNCYRPLLLLKQVNAKTYPENIRIPSKRQEIGDSRANPKGRVPGDVFDFPRVVGNAKERRSWHPTQLNEGLVRRCLLFSTAPGDLIVDPFAGTGTVLRVCQEIERHNLSIEISPQYCENIAFENKMEQMSETEWVLEKTQINILEKYFG